MKKIGFQNVKNNKYFIILFVEENFHRVYTNKVHIHKKLEILPKKMLFFENFKNLPMKKKDFHCV